jgi:hypothetical protein
MRERAAAVGGIIQAGPGPGGGFRVTARLPAPPQPGGWPAPADATDQLRKAGPAHSPGPADDGPGPADGPRPADETEPATDGRRR